MSESSYGIKKINQNTADKNASKNQQITDGWDSASDYTDIQITGGNQLDLNSSFVSETQVTMGEIVELKPTGSEQVKPTHTPSTTNETGSAVYLEGDSAEEDSDSNKHGLGGISEEDEEETRRNTYRRQKSGAEVKSAGFSEDDTAVES